MCVIDILLTLWNYVDPFIRPRLHCIKLKAVLSQINRARCRNHFMR